MKTITLNVDDATYQCLEGFSIQTGRGIPDLASDYLTDSLAMHVEIREARQRYEELRRKELERKKLKEEENKIPELKPCPVCGSEAIIEFIVSDDDDYCLGYVAKCSNVHCPEYLMTDGFMDEKDASIAWNNGEFLWHNANPKPKHHQLQ